MAYQRGSKSLFAAAYQKAGAGFGPGGPAQIYRYDGNNNAISPFLNLGTVLGDPTIAGTDQHVYGFDIPASFPTDDSYHLVGKMSFGDLDISEDGKTLWLINLADKKLYKLPLGNDVTNPIAPSAAQISSYDTPTNQPTCTGIDVRPFGLGVFNDKVYIGSVCSGESTNNNTTLRVYVNEFDPTTGNFTEVLTYLINNSRQVNNPPLVNLSWKNWNASAGYGAQPWLTDIEFDEHGNMFMGIRDRFAEAGRIIDYTVHGYGDLVVACYDGSAWTVENNGSCGGTTYTGTGNSQGLGGGEFYTGDHGNGSPGSGGTSNTFETLQGALLYLPTENDLLSSSNDYNNLQQGSVTWLDHANGSQIKGFEIYKTQGFPIPPTFGKANGLGDLEVLADPAPLEIGNRIWSDTDSDGIQDADETGIDDITVELYEGATLVGTAITANGGQWYFNNSNVNLNGATELKPNTAYTIRVLSSEFPSGQTLTATNSDGTTNGDVRDSDASLVGGNAEIAYTTGDYGQNDHTLDIGLKTASPDLSLAKTVNTAIATLNSQVTFTLTLTNDNGVDATGVIVTDELPAGVTFVSTSDPANAVVSGSTITWNVGSFLGTDAPKTLDITVTASNEGSFINNTEITAMNETDSDSTPSNDTMGEDDQDQACFSVPVSLCSDNAAANITVTANTATSYQWYVSTDNGASYTALSGETSQSLLINNTLMGGNGVTKYFKVAYNGAGINDGCGAVMCCPIIVTTQTCIVCPAPKCIPVSITKTNP
jgi:uncharacterized repeat protein (TIGR01451 family)